MPRSAFLGDILGEFKQLGDTIKKLEVPELGLRALDRTGDRGWWLAIQGMAIMKYMAVYLATLRKQESITLDFIDIAAGPGIYRVSANPTSQEIFFPGASMLAAWQAFTGDGLAFDSIFAFDRVAAHRQQLLARFEILGHYISTNGLDSPRFVVPRADAPGKVDPAVAVSSIIDEIKRDHGRFYNYLCFVDDADLNVPVPLIEHLHRELPYGDVIISIPLHALGWYQEKRRFDTLKVTFGIDASWIDSTASLESIFLQRLKGFGFKVISRISCKRVEKAPVDLLFCSRRENQAWTDIVTDYNDRLGKVDDKDIRFAWDLFTGRAATLPTMLARLKGSGTAAAAKGKERVPDAVEVLIWQNDGAYSMPMFAGQDDFAWKDILSKNAFDRLRINGELDLLKKILSGTDLRLHSACIQGSMRQKLGISKTEARDIYLLDRRTGEAGPASFPLDGRLEGTAFWLRRYKDELQDGNFMFLAKLEDDQKIIILIDYYQQKYPVLPFLKEFYADFARLQETGVDVKQAAGQQEKNED
jgi:hypothetical protein